MTALVTALTEFATNGNSRTYTTSGHTASKPKLVIQKRRVPEGNQVVQETTVSVIQAAVDPNDMVMPSKVVFSATIRYPIGIKTSDTTVADALVIFRDVVQSTEFGTTVTSQNFLK